MLATFHQIRVNDMVYMIVFGESLLNDGISVVLYEMFDTFCQMRVYTPIKALDIGLGCLSFLVVAIGGSLIGLVFGFVGSFTTKYTGSTPVIEPFIVIIFAYLSYLTAETLSASAILAYV